MLCMSTVQVQVLLTFYFWSLAAYKGAVYNFDCIGLDSIKLFAFSSSGD